MALIYTPKGPAFEYADFALNLYKGCEHGCTYCYAPNFAYMMKNPQLSKEKFKKATIRGPLEKSEDDRIRKLLKQLQREAKISYNNRILMSFTTDPYQPIEEKYHLTRSAIEILGSNNLITVLTKAPNRALKDLGLFKKHNIEFAQTICFVDDKTRETWEPYADPIQARMEALDVVRKEGLKSWVSIEPIIDAKEVLLLVEALVGKTDLIKIGPVDNRWNPDMYDSIEWSKLLLNVLERLDDQNYYIKNDFWKHATDNIKNKFKKTTVKALEKKYVQ